MWGRLSKWTISGLAPGRSRQAAAGLALTQTLSGRGGTWTKAREGRGGGGGRARGPRTALHPARAPAHTLLPTSGAPHCNARGWAVVPAGVFLTHSLTHSLTYSLTHSLTQRTPLLPPTCPTNRALSTVHVAVHPVRPKGASACIPCDGKAPRVWALRMNMCRARRMSTLEKRETRQSGSRPGRTYGVRRVAAPEGATWKSRASHSPSDLSYYDRARRMNPICFFFIWVDVA